MILCGSAFPRETPPSIPPAYWLLMDGVPGDSTDVTARLQEILNLCATRTGYLRLDSGVYLLTDSIVVPDGVTFEGNQAKLQFEIGGTKKALCLESNTRVAGFVIDVDSTTAITGDGTYGAPICIGQYNTGEGFSQIRVSDLTLHTERVDGNGITYTGNSHDIDITNIHFPNSVNMGRAILGHWGNTGYDVAEDTGRTYHPHNISISKITIDTMFLAAPYSVGIYTSGCYNVDIENVNILQAGKAFHAYVGDVGYRYADPDYLDTSVIEGQGITVSRIFINEATLNGFSVDGLSPILDTATGISDSDAVWDLPVHVSNSTFGSNGNNNGVVLSNCRNVILDNCVFDGFASGFATGANVINTKILNCTFRNGQNHGVNLSNSATPTSSPQDITVDNCFLYNNGLADSTLYAGIRVNDASRCILTNNRIGLTAGEWVKYGVLVTQSGAGHILAKNHVFDVSGGGSAYSFVSGDSTLVLSWANTAASGLTVPPPRVMSDTVRFTGVIETERYFKTDNPTGTAADFKSSHPIDTRVKIANTDSGNAVISFDAINGDFTGGDYAKIGQNDSGYFEFALEPSAPNWAFRFTDATNIYLMVDKTALTIGAYAITNIDGSADQVLTTDGSGTVSWNTQAGAGGGESNTIQDTGVYNETEGFGLSGGKAGVDLHVKGLIEGSNITIATSGDSGLTITATGGGDGLDTTEVLDILRDSISGDATVGAGGVMTVVDDLHDHVYSNIDATTSANWIGRVSDETGTGVWVFGTQPTFTTDLEVPLIIGGTATTSDLSLKTTSGVGETGADMHFLVGNNGATEAMTILNDGNVGIGTTPDVILHLKADVAHGPFIKLDRTDGTWIDDVAIIGVSGTASDVDTDFLWMGKSTGDKDFMLQFNTGNVGIGNGIGVILPPEKLSVLGNIATGDTATGEVDVYHYFSTNGSWTTEYLMWDDNPGCFVISDALDVDGNILLSGTVDGVEISNLNTDVAADSGSWNATADALGTAIDSTKTTNESMSEADLTISNAPTDEYALTWEASAGTGGQMTWEAQAGGSPSLEDIFNYMHPDIFDTTGFNDSIGIKANGITDGMVTNALTVDEASDADTSGTKLSAALADRLDDLLSDVYKYFDRTYFDTLIDASGDSIICIYSDSTDLSIFDTDDLAEGSSNKYDQALPDSGEWSIAYDSSQEGYLNPADPNVDTAAWNAGGGGEANTLSDTGTFNGTSGFGLAGGKTGTALKVKGLIEGFNITIAPSGDSAYTITGTGVGTRDSTYINDGTQYGPFTNDMYKIKEGTGINIVRDDSTTYDVFNFNATLGTSIEYGEITATTSANWAGLVSDETGTGVWVFGTSPTFTTDITSPLVIGGTATTSDLSLKTTSGVGETGADMHFLVGDNGATEAMTILNNGNVGIGTATPVGPLEIVAASPGGNIGGFASGMLHVRGDGAAEFSNSVITGHNSYAGNTQLWYLGSGSFTNDDVAFINRQNANLVLSTNNIGRMTIDAGGNVGIGTDAPTSKVEVVSTLNVLADLAVEENYHFKVRNPNNTIGEGIGISFGMSGTGSQQTAAIVASRTGANGQGDLRFYTKQSVTSGVAPALGMIIDSAGNVGIGTATPDEVLHLFGNNAALKLEDDSENDATIHVGNSQLCLAIDPGDLVASSDICFDIDGSEVARFHSTTNFGIGTLSPPERLTVVGNIATGDTTTGDVDVYKYFSTDGSYTDEYFPKWDDGLGRFEISDDLDITGNLTVSGTVPAAWDWQDSAGEPPFWVDSAKYSSVTGGLKDAFVAGKLTVTGPIDRYNIKLQLDTTNIYCPHADTFLNLPVDTNTDNPADSFEMMHPSVVYIPAGKWGYKYWFAGTPLGSGLHEDPHILVSNDEETWVQFMTATDTLHNPVFEITDFEDGDFLSDPEIIHDENGDLLLVFRVARVVNGQTIFYLYCASSSDGIDWSDTTMMIDGYYNKGNELSPDTGTLKLISPGVIMRGAGDYLMYTGEDTTDAQTGPPLRAAWVAPRIDTLWDNAPGFDETYLFGTTPLISDTVRVSMTQYTMPAGNKMWHADEIIHGTDFIVSLYNSDSASTFPRIYMAVSLDGEYFTTVSAPLLANTNNATAWDKTSLYRASGYFIYRGAEIILRMYYSAKNSDNEWHTGLTDIHFGNVLHTKELLIWNPDLITDTVPIFEADSLDYPGGITIQSVAVQTSEDGTYVLKFMSFTSADPPVFHDWVDTLNVGASDQRASSIIFEDDDSPLIDRGQELYMLTPATDIAWIKVKYKFYVRDWE